MTASIQTEPRTLHTDCRPCGNPAWIGCCELCEARARFLAHVVAPLDPEPVAIARVVYVPRDIRDAGGLVAIAAIAA